MSDMRARLYDCEQTSTRSHLLKTLKLLAVGIVEFASVVSARSVEILCISVEISDSLSGNSPQCWYLHSTTIFRYFWRIIPAEKYHTANLTT